MNNAKQATMNVMEPWTSIRKRFSGRYARYDNQPVIILTRGRKDPEALYLHLPAVVDGWLGRPDFVDVQTRGKSSNVAIVACEPPAGYKLQRTTRTVPYATISQLLLPFPGLRAGVYHAHVEDGRVVFDTADTPSSLPGG